MAQKNWSNSTFVRTALPTFGFVVFAWLGLSQLMDSKLRIRSQMQGRDNVEEYDPTERMRRLASGADRKLMGGPTPTGRRPAVRSLEEELAQLQRQVDIHNFDYVPVPRTDDDDDEGGSGGH